LRKQFTGQWVLEILGLLLAFLALAAIIITLAIHQNRPLPAWPHDISINALVAIFTAALKAGLLVPVVTGMADADLWLLF
jgi:branched-subunit amino acid transport protein